ncbi:hypothetical protein [Aneurinibacillus tyrosinisolvens]|uniref:hypothetical protein n=1 Tax=Aneurinibacillus tyrosinisolvens TaxID=1443435 RepID=UPI00063F86EC|nr:hypothetical protein [Aneurinibacillus tyrosinisolvens]
MNLQNICAGDIVKNYKELCALLGQTDRTGNSKKSQIAEWERHFKYSKSGNKFVIEEIYETPLEKEENRGGANRILPHADRMDRVLMYILNKEETNGELFLTRNTLLKEMNMINGNYKFCDRNVKKVSTYLNIEEAIIEEFFVSTKRTFTSNIESMLNRLSSGSFLFWSKVKTVCVADAQVKRDKSDKLKIEKRKVFDEYGNMDVEILVNGLPTGQKSFRAATDEEIEIILTVEGEVLDSMDFKDKQEVVQHGKWDEFIDQVNDILFERANIVFYYNSYKIIRNKARLQREVDENLEQWIQDEKEFTFEAISLNGNVATQMFNNLENRQKKAIKELAEGRMKSKTKMRLSEDYLTHYGMLIDAFLNWGYQDIIREVRETVVKDKTKHKGLRAF